MNLLGLQTPSSGALVGRPGTPHIAVVVLNYNSEKDLKICAEQLAGQLDVSLSMIIVDNASHPACVRSIREWLARWRPNAISGTEGQVSERIRAGESAVAASAQVFFVENPDNRGYSAGNNTGIRIAHLIRADAVLIANPDMRFDDRRYVRELARHLFADPLHAIAASRIVDLAGNDQSPLREPGFLEELLWPRYLVRRLIGGMSQVLAVSGREPVSVPKVAGCCLLLRSEFLQLIGNLDEHVFLYCEEAILSAQIRSTGRRIVHVPRLSAIHAHVAASKGKRATRMLRFIASRRYYLRQYSGYRGWRLRLLFLSYAALALYYRIEEKRGR